MADSGSDMSQRRSTRQCPDTGQMLSGSSDEREVSSVTGDNLNGSTASAKPNPFQVIKPAVFVPSGMNPFATTFKADSGLASNSGHTLSPAKFVLRPSALSSQPHNVKTAVSAINDNAVTLLLKPAKLPDPTKHSSKDQEGTEKENTEIAAPALTDTVTAGSVPTHKDLSDRIEETKDKNIFQAIVQQHAEKGLPDSSSSPSKCNSHTSANKGLIFGENLAEKVIGVQTSPQAPVSSSGFVFGENLAERVQFQADDQDINQTDNGAASPDSTYSSEQACAAADGTKTLEESAREYQATHGRKTELQEVEVVTGEENESNVIQANGKLFVFDGDTQNWVERGRGLLRLNDMSCESSSAFQSRLLMRTQGSLRLILNTKIWSGMTVERASHKSVRITGTDGDCVRVFLIMTNPKDSENLLRALDWRVQQLQVQGDLIKDLGVRSMEKRKAELESPTEELVAKKIKKSDEGHASYNKQEESDSSVIDPETEVSSESHASSFTPRTDSD